MRHYLILLYARLNHWYRKPLMYFDKGINLLYVPGFNKLRHFNAKAKAYSEFIKAKRNVPAYREFLKKHNFSKPSFSGLIPNIHEIPSTDKETYVNRYSMAERCVNGHIPNKGVIIDESSGSSGTAVNWARGAVERQLNARFIEWGMKNLMGKEPIFVINVFALGPWATGVNITMSCVRFSKLKSLGPDKIKIENTLRHFGTGEKYIVMGYPPFLKSLVDTSDIPWHQYDVSFIFGGEAMSEGMRDYLYKSGIKKVYSSLGASDVELNISAENDFTISLRKLLAKDKVLQKRVIKYEGALPMVFQYNPADFLMECSEKGELIITVCRANYIAPKIRYNLHDKAQIMQMKELNAILDELKIDRTQLIPPRTDLPLLFHYGRSDMAVSFFGANITPNDIQETLFNIPEMTDSIRSFFITTEEDENGTKKLIISLEIQQDKEISTISTERLQPFFFETLANINQDFREAKRMLTKNDQTLIRLYDFASGPFENSDARVKAKYIR